MQRFHLGLLVLLRERHDMDGVLDAEYDLPAENCS